MADGFSLWVPAISALAGIGGALGSQWLSHIFITRREKRASEEKLQRERYFIGTQLVFLLERFAQQCVRSATGLGNYDYKGCITLKHTLPELDYATVTGDWRSLPDELMYGLSELPVLHEEAQREIGASAEHDTPFNGDLFSRSLERESCSLGLRAIRLSRQLRQLCGMPQDELSQYPWSAWKILSELDDRLTNDFISEARNSVNARKSSPQTPTGDI